MASNRVATGNISGIVIGHDNRGTIIQYNVLGSSGANERIEIFLPAPASDAATTNRFTFTARRTGWAGRDAEMAQLAGFRDRSEPFLWWLVAGAGGTGKSRLALEFCSESATPCPPDSRRSPSWWARIFGRKPSEPTPEPRWHCGFLPLSEAQKDTDAPRLTRLAEPWKLWQPDRPTLIVIDYVVQRPRFTGQLVHALAQRSDLAHPVRLLLLERDAKGSWQQDFRAPDQITQSSVDATRHAEALELRAPGDDALWSIIHTMSGDRATDRTEALTQLREIDSKTRPLFAAFLGDAMGHDRPPRHWDRDALFDDVIRRYRDHFWTPAGVTDADESLLCLATLTSGAFSSWLQNPEPRPPAFPVPLPAINRDLERRYQAMTGAPVTEIDDPDNPILFPPLQPDLLGEFFVLRHLTTETGATWRSSLRAWLNASWSLDPGGTAVFLDRLGADFADDKHIPAFFEMPPSQALPVRHFWAMLIVNRGFRLGQLGRGAEAIAVYDTVIERFENAPEAALREQVATALVNKGVTLGQLGRSAEAIAVYDTVIERFENAPEAALREQVATALRNKGFRLGQLGHSAEAIAVYDTLIERFENAPEAALREQVATALRNKGFRLGQLGHSAEEIAVYDTVFERFENAPEAALREQVAKALVNKGVTLGQLGRSAEAIAVYDTLIERFENAPEAALREPVAKALVNKGVTLGQLGRSAEAIAVYDTLIERFENAPEAALREPVATALVNKGVTLGQLGRSAEEIAVYDTVFERFENAPEAALREQVAKALVNKGVTLGQLDRGAEAILVLNDVIRRFGDAAEPPFPDIVATTRQVLEVLSSAPSVIPDGSEPATANG